MRNFKTLALAGVIGVFALASDASACHKKKCACPTPTVAYVAPAPVVECAPVKVKKCKMPKMPKMGCHKKAVCAPTAYAAAPVSYGAPAMASPQASGQGMSSGQGM